MSFSLQPLMVFYLFLIGILSLYGLHRYWILFLYYKHYKKKPPYQPSAWQGPLPMVTVQLPLYNERYVVRRLIEAVSRLNYPREALEIQVLDDSTDDTQQLAQAYVQEFRAKGFNIHYLHREKRVGFKAGALAAGLVAAKGEFIAIFDADFMPPPQFLQKTVPCFEDPKLGMVQTRWGHLNEDHSLLTSLQSIFLDGHFLIEQTARNRSGAFFNFNGTAGIWRREAIESSGGWQHDTLTEDLDLSYRAQLNGWSFMFLPEVVCPAELPVDIAGFKTQQYRWTMGAIQTARKVLPGLWKSRLPGKVKIEATFHLMGCAAYVLMALLSLLLPLTLFYRRNIWSAVGVVEVLAMVTTSVSVAIFYCVCLKELYPDWRARAKTLPLMISLGIGICWSNALAVLRGLTRRSYEFRRTPKYSVISRDRTWKRKRYRSGSRWAAWFETALAVYFMAGTWIAIDRQLWASIPFLALFGFGYAYVAVLTTLQGITVRPTLPLPVSQPLVSE